MIDKEIFKVFTRLFSFIFIGFLTISISYGSVKTFKRVLILGNSITAHGPAPDIGWNGNWGMAASKKENDFVHLLEAKFKARNKEVEVQYANIAGSFESKYWDFDKGALSEFKDKFQPDLIIVRLGENIPVNMLGQHSLAKALKSLITYVSNGRRVKVCITTTFWENKAVSDIIKKVGTAQHWDVVNLSGLSAQNGAMAVDQFTNKAVGSHPSDKGMKLIADEIWKKLSRYKY
jgi:lysophospholipase L1-like esterase